MPIKTFICLPFIIFISLNLTPLPAWADNKCQKHYDSLKNVRSIMRHGYTVTYGEYLRNKERKIKEQIRLCKKGKSSELSYYSSNISKSKKQKPKNYNIYTPNKDQLGNQTLAVKGLFKGKKQQDWIDFYQRPKECLSPKTISAFSKCLKHRDDAADNFSFDWDKKTKKTKTPSNKFQVSNSKKAKTRTHRNNSEAKNRAIAMRQSVCLFWKDKHDKKPLDSNIKDIMELECKTSK